jgi:hypothetical protein
MKITKAAIASMAFFGLADLLLAQGAIPVQRNTKVTISEPTEVSGTILQPGTYTLKVLDFQSGKLLVQVSDADDRKVITTVTTQKVRRNLDTDREVEEQAEFTYTTANGHPALKVWFYPGDEWGEQFASGKATWVAQDNVTVRQVPFETEKVAEVTESPAPEPVAEIPRPTELPKTASDLPLLGIAGLIAVGAAAGIGRMSS